MKKHDNFLISNNIIRYIVYRILGLPLMFHEGMLQFQEKQEYYRNTGTQNTR